MKQFKPTMKFIIFVCIFVVSSVLATCPNGIANGGVSDKDQKLILSRHNTLRYKIMKGQIAGQPKGVNLKELKWDESLAKEAERIANNCEFKHQKAYSDKWTYVGQNLFWSATPIADDTGSDWNAAANSWFDEHKTYTFGEGYNHYTQAVWADSEYIGCGFSVYNLNDGWKFNKLYVCHYGPGGNMSGEKPYKTG